jgi:8-oxo-dGTP pyrophosphatase MutT (NUDIX family)/phosphohistidine phosphatase SixA
MSQVHNAGFDVAAAGAVLWRPDPSGQPGPQIALVHRPRYDDWSLPKGKVGRGETNPAAAVREVAEETGYTAFLGARLGCTSYRVPEGDKVVHYWSARAVSGEFVPNNEVDELRWMAPEAAAGVLTHAHDGELLDRFLEVSPPASPLLLVRHAKASHRQQRYEDDDLRPLTPKGHRQADELAVLLPLFGPARVYAAPPVRCPQTVQPLADRLGLPILEEPLLGEQGYWADPDAALARLLELADVPDVPVVCSQGGVIPDLVERLAGLSDVPSRKASVWVLGFAGGRLVSADYYDQPGPA